MALAVSVAAGCVERTLVIESAPPGAEVRLNGAVVGKTPVHVPFRHYGVYDVEVRKEGFETVRAAEEVPAPCWARFPLGVFAELLWPGRIQDTHFLEYDLAPPAMPDRAKLLERAEAAAKRLAP
ncbi:MAG: PEGA domain-containing protein [Planctomycetota bacterium]